MDRKNTGIKPSFLIIIAFFLILSFGTGESRALNVPDSFADLAENASPSVVNVSVEKVTEIGGGENTPFGAPSPYGGEDPFQDFLKRFFGNNMPRKYKERGLGSGFIIEKEGYILTNNHVVEDTDKIVVTLNNEKEYDAKIIGKDPKTDIALIKIDAGRDLVPLKLGDSEKIRVGDWVVAIGSPFGLGHTVTAGIVSAKYRRIGMGAYDDFIQTDASINPGNSGGPLLNTDGEVVGINSAIFSQSGGNVGIGFAIPANMVKDLLPQLKKGKVIRGWLGVMIQEITPELKEKLKLKEAKGALVSDVTADSPAEKGGIKRGDVIISYDGKEIKEMNDLPYMVAVTPVGEKVKIKIDRNGQEITKVVEIAKAKETETLMKEHMKQTGPRLGMSLVENSPEYARQYNLPDSHGLIVTEVIPGSPAAEAGIQAGDIILQLDNEPVDDLNNFKEKIGKYKKGDTLLFLIKRESGTVYLTLKLEE